MKKYFLIVTLFLLIGCNTNKTDQIEEQKPYSFFVGTYTNSTSKGIYHYILNGDGTITYGGLAAIAENPSFLAYSFDRKYVLAVGETDINGAGTIQSYEVKNDSLLLVSTRSSGGAHPCFVGVNKKGYALAANYSGGNVGLVQINKKGFLDTLLDVQQHFGSGVTERQKGPHAHSVWFVPSNDNEVIAVDLGTNQLWFSTIDEEQKKLIPAVPNKLAMADGAGPRHLTFHPNNKWIYVLNELNNTITHVVKSESGYEVGTSVPTLPSTFTTYSKTADIHISSDGKFVYASNRGHESIVIFSVNENNGELSLVGHQEVKGKEPRNFALSPDERFLIVANQNTNNLVSFSRDSSSGMLTFVSEIEAPTPVCILF